MELKESEIPASSSHGYCRICGAANVPEWNGYYDPKTGEKVIRGICSVAPCQHGVCDIEDVGSTWLGDTKLHCRRCGARWIYGG